ncbi:hypothetical protein R6Z07_014960 [Ovis aries]
MKASVMLQEYKAVGRCLPTSKCRTPSLYRMKIFAPNDAFAKSRLVPCVSVEEEEEILGEIVYCGQCYRYRARAHSIQIMKVEEIAAGKGRRPAVKQFHDPRLLLTAPPKPPWPAQATLHHQQANTFFLGAGPLSPDSAQQNLVGKPKKEKRGPLITDSSMLTMVSGSAVVTDLTSFQK